MTSNERARRLHPVELITHIQGPLHHGFRHPFQVQARSCEPPQSVIRGTSLIAGCALDRCPSPREGELVRGDGRGHLMLLNEKRKGKHDRNDCLSSAFGCIVIAMRISKLRITAGSTSCGCELEIQGGSRGRTGRVKGTRGNVLTFRRGRALVYPSDERQCRIRYHVVTSTRFPLQR